MGKWKVAIHDNTQQYQPWEKPYYVLGAGDVYNMKTRKVVKYADGTTPDDQRMLRHFAALGGATA
jgi:hypothetical protein